MTTRHIDILVKNKGRFLAFLEQRLGSRADAEDLLQTAYLKAFTAANTLRFEEKVVSWFYRVLRNLLIDHCRNRTAVNRLEERFATEAEAEVGIDEELFQEICHCVKEVAEAVKPEYREMLLRVELQDEPLPQVAHDLSITANNASVRLHRARSALREALRVTCGVCAEHRCLDCTCRSGRRAAPRV
ncbi:MAG TPA: sigma-70 family RNA polymerase sigma factor [Nitrospiraceae bacterium]|nr:sigma-70 family RNA polymerase sigma factor [Nitrospiraceae bacterium]